jgi:hypothetical protein
VITPTPAPVAVPTPVVVIPAPTISMGATPSSVTSGQSTSVSWTALNVNYCTVTSGSINDYGPGSAPLVGSLVVGPLTAPRTVTITCPGKNGTTATQTITIPVITPTPAPVPVPTPVVVIPAPTVSISATPSTVTFGQSTIVSWSSTNVNSCTVVTGSVNDYGVGSAPLVGSLLVGPVEVSQTAIITCLGKNGTTATQSIGINVRLVPTKMLLNQIVAMGDTAASLGSVIARNVPGTASASASTGCIDIKTNLHRGFETGSVSQLQNFLIQKGFLSTEVSGFFGDLTISAVKAYQRSLGLPETGMVYDFTRQAIKQETCN